MNRPLPNTNKKDDVIRIFIDFEFLDKGLEGIEIVSVGLVDDDGEEYYAINTSILCAYFTGEGASQWVIDNVFPSLTPPDEDFGLWRCPTQIRDDITKFIGKRIPEFWGYYSAYDYVLLCRLMGGIDTYPDNWPMLIHDTHEFNRFVPALAKPENPGVHHALNDARWTRDLYANMVRDLGCELLDARMEMG